VRQSQEDLDLFVPPERIPSLSWMSTTRRNSTRTILASPSAPFTTLLGSLH